jgi:hypothetical protein
MRIDGGTSGPSAILAAGQALGASKAGFAAVLTARTQGASPSPSANAASYDVTNEPVNYAQLSKNAIAALEQAGHASDPKSGYTNWTSILSTLRAKQQAATSGINVTV